MAGVTQYKLTYADGKVLYIYGTDIPSFSIPAGNDLVTIEAM